MPFLALVIINVLLTLAMYALQPKPEKRGPGEFQAPICEQGAPYAYIAGCARIRGVNAVWAGTPRVKGKKSDQIYDFWCRLQLAICLGPVDRIRRMWFGQDAIPTVRVSSDNTIPQPIFNTVGISNVTTYNSAPYPAGTTFHVGNQDAHVGTVVMVGTAPGVSTWGYQLSNGHRLQDAAPPKNAFAIYGKKNFPSAPGVHNGGEPGYGWLFFMPVNGHTVFRNSVYSKFDGASWNSQAALTLPYRQEWDVKLHSDEKGIKVSGRMRWYPGSASQGVDDHLQKWQRNGGTTPTHGGVCYVVLTEENINSDRGFYWGESPSIPEVSFEVERIPDPLGLGAKAVPSYTIAAYQDNGTNRAQDANPANILYELLTDPVAGLGASALDIDIASFRDAGRILYHEGVGMTIVLDQQATFDDAAKDILAVADGALFEDPETGLWTFRLIRDPISGATAATYGLEGTWYTNTSFLALGEDDTIGDPEFTRGSWGDVANEIKIQFIDRSEGYAQRVVDVKDIANFQSQGETVSVQNTYNAITNRDLAIRVAYRDIRAVGYPRARLKIQAKRLARDLRTADCFVWSYSPLGISNMRMRVTQIRYGTRGNPRVEIEAVEDSFGMPSTVYSEPGSGAIDPGSIPPVPPAAVRAWELAYDVTRDGPRVGFAALVARGDPYTTGAILWANVDGVLQEVGPISYAPTGLTSSALAIEETTASIQLQGLQDFGDIDSVGLAVGGNNLVLVDDELIAFDAIGHNADGTIYLSGCLRGVLDTIPRAHALGARAWLVRNPPPAQPDITTVDHLENFVIQATNAYGVTDPLGEVIQGGMTDSRELRPFVPGKFRVASSDLPTALQDRLIAGDVLVGWEHRNRLTQAPGAVSQTDTGIDPEANQLARLALRKGISEAFNPYLPPSLGSGPWPFGETVKFTGAPSTWIVFQDATWFDAVGIKDWGSFPWSAFTFSATEYIYLNIDSPNALNDYNSGPWTYGYDYYGNRTGRVYLFRAVWTYSGGNASVVLTDLRGTAAESVLVDAAGVSNYTIEPADIVSLGLTSLSPNRAILDAHRDGLDSMEQRRSGLVLEAGYGMGYGMLYGGAP